MNDSRIGGVLFLVVSCLYGYFASDIPLDFWSEQEVFNARSMPLLLAGLGIIASLLLIAMPSPRTDFSLLARQRWAPAVLLLTLMVIYSLVLEPVGFAVSTIAFLIAAFMVLGERRLLPMLAVSVPLTLGFWLLMDRLGIYLAPGALLDALAATGN